MSRRPVNRLLTQSPVFSLRHKSVAVPNYSIRVLLEAAAIDNRVASFGFIYTAAPDGC